MTTLDNIVRLCESRDLFDSLKSKYHSLFERERSEVPAWLNNPTLFLMMKGIHSDAKNEWLMAFDNIVEDLFNEPDSLIRYRMIHDLADEIRGIGPVTADLFYAFFELKYPDGLESYRNF